MVRPRHIARKRLPRPMKYCGYSKKYHSLSGESGHFSLLAGQTRPLVFLPGAWYIPDMHVGVRPLHEFIEEVDERH